MAEHGTATAGEGRGVSHGADPPAPHHAQCNAAPMDELAERVWEWLISGRREATGRDPAVEPATRPHGGRTGPRTTGDTNPCDRRTTERSRKVGSDRWDIGGPRMPWTAYELSESAFGLMTNLKWRQ